MRVLWLIPPSVNIQTIVDSFRPWMCQHHDSIEIRKIFFGPDFDMSEVDSFAADWVFYVGAVGGVHSLSLQELHDIRQKSKIVLFCTGDPGWEPYLQTYVDHNTFTLIVVLCARTNVPLRHEDLALFPPVNRHAFLNGTSRAGKDILLGYMCGMLPARARFLRGLGPLATELTRCDTYGSYQDYVTQLQRCVFGLNINFLDESHEVEAFHLRIIEFGLAEAIVLEKKGSIVSEYFEPGLEYLEYESTSDIINFIAERDRYVSLPFNMKARILSDYSSDVFWYRISTHLDLLD